jgi:hypothetical protein
VKSGALFTLTLLVVVFTSALLVGLGLWSFCRGGEVLLGSAGTYLSGAGTVMLAIAAIVGGAVGLSDYRKKATAEKAKWLLQLFEKLFENSNYTEVRRKLDYDDLADVKTMIERDGGSEPFTAAEQIEFDRFTDYLNFFEFVAHLKAIGQLTSEDIGAVFDYYLRLLTWSRNPEIRRYLVETGFENLDSLLKQDYDGKQ